MLDSESNLREGLAKLSTFSARFDSTTPLSELPIDAADLSGIDHMVDAALYFHEATIDGYAVDPYCLDPALTLIEGLKREFAGSKLIPILEGAGSAISNAKASKTGAALATDLAELMPALEPWLMSGAPSHYKSKGLIAFRDNETRRLWLQDGGLPANPYSSASATVIEWPNPMAEAAP
jgi:Cu(I)/Ag(I) efflux system membrane fusion protein